MGKRFLAVWAALALGFLLAAGPSQAQYDPGLAELAQRTADTAMALGQYDYPQRLAYLAQDMRQYGQVGGNVVTQTLRDMVAQNPALQPATQQLANDLNAQAYAAAPQMVPMAPAPPVVPMIFLEREFRHEHELQEERFRREQEERFRREQAEHQRPPPAAAHPPQAAAPAPQPVPPHAQQPAAAAPSPVQTRPSQSQQPSAQPHAEHEHKCNPEHEHCPR